MTASSPARGGELATSNVPVTWSVNMTFKPKANEKTISTTTPIFNTVSSISKVYDPGSKKISSSTVRAEGLTSCCSTRLRATMA